MQGWSRWNPGDVNPDAKNKPREICPVKNGYGLGFESMRVFEGGVSPYSIMDKLGRVLLPSLDAIKARQQTYQNQFPAIKDMLQVDKVAFFVKAANTATSVDVDERPEMADEPPQIRLSNWFSPNNGDDGGGASAAGAEAGQFIDILQSDAMAATNCPDIQSACALLELAANAGALSLIVCANQFRQGQRMTKSMLYAYPLVDTRKLLDCLQV